MAGVALELWVILSIRKDQEKYLNVKENYIGVSKIIEISPLIIFVIDIVVYITDYFKELHMVSHHNYEHVLLAARKTGLV